MAKRFLVGISPSYVHSYDDIEPERSEMIESPHGEYVLYSSHQVTVNLYNKTLKNYQLVKKEKSALVDENMALKQRIAELEALQS